MFQYEMTTDRPGYEALDSAAREVFHTSLEDLAGSCPVVAYAFLVCYAEEAAPNRAEGVKEGGHLVTRADDGPQAVDGAALHALDAPDPDEAGVEVTIRVYASSRVLAACGVTSERLSFRVGLVAEAA